MLASLASATTFDDAAASFLSTVRSVVDAAIQGGEHARDGSFARGVLHIRPDRGYRGLVVLEETDRFPVVEVNESDIVSSASAWRFLNEHRKPLAIDVLSGQVTVLQTGSSSSDYAISESPSHQTIDRLTQRSTTHLLVVPLVFGSGALDGMVSVEANCRSAIGRGFVWDEVVDAIQLLTDIAAPHILRAPLPRSSPRPDDVDEHLPVAGEAMGRTLTFLRAFAAQRETVLLSGPTGSGKTRLAEWIHHRSPMRDGPFEAVDLLAIPEELQLVELFGWRRGSFTGASGDHRGAVERAAGGTLLIDEIDKLSPRAQAGLLQLLDTRQYRPLGSEKARVADDVRFIISTNVDLGGAVGEGAFRQDLYYRINVLRVSVPGLDERRDEIAEWAQHFAASCHRDGGGAGDVELSSTVTRRLTDAQWPGHLRQLDNVVRRAYAIAASEQGRDDVQIDDRHLQLAFAVDTNEQPDDDFISLLERAADALLADAIRLADEPSSNQEWIKKSNVVFPMVWYRATQRLQDPKTVAHVLGLEGLIQSRNYQREFKRELGKLLELYQLRGAEAPPLLTQSLGGAGSDAPRVH